MKKSDKPKLLVINRAYLTNKEKYKNLNKNNIGMVIHDECHNTTANNCFEFLKHCKDNKIPVIGFSATPLRTGKTKCLKTTKLISNIDRLLSIYGIDDKDENKLNLLTDYSMIHAIKENLILPPKFIWYEFENKDGMKNINDEEFIIISKLLNKIVENYHLQK